MDPTDHAAEEANIWLRSRGLPVLPPVDGIDQWSYIMNGQNGRDGELHLSSNGILRWPYKLVTGPQPYSVRDLHLTPTYNNYHLEHLS